MDCSENYMRRIKTVAVFIPAVTGPYTNINCTPSLQKITIRKSAIGKDYARDLKQDDSRFLDYFGTIQSIVTSDGQNDSGLYEVNLRNERFLPFENAGVESTWQLNLPAEHRKFDYNTIYDLILHVRYTSREGRAQLATNNITKEILEPNSESGLSRLFSLKHDFPNSWYKFKISESESFAAKVSRDQFPYIAQLGTIVLSENPFDIWRISKKDFKVVPVPFISEGILLEIDEFNSDSREGEIVINVELNKAEEYFLLINYTL